MSLCSSKSRNILNAVLKLTMGSDYTVLIRNAKDSALGFHYFQHLSSHFAHHVCSLGRVIQPAPHFLRCLC